jgi:hypothetical protein
MVTLADLVIPPEHLDRSLHLLPPPEKVVALLASGIEEEEARLAQEAEDETRPSIVGRLLSAMKERGA